MIFLEVGNLGSAILMLYLMGHLPAFILLIISAVKWKKNRSTAKKFLIAAVVYFIIGGGICGALLS